MKTNREIFVVRKLTLIVQSALLAMLALPMTASAEESADAETTALTHPTNFVELGAMNVGHKSAKFGEYNGLDDSGAYAIGNFDVRGGSAYDGGDGTLRWQAKGINLGTDSREVGGSVSSQGHWDIGVKYDELRHNLSDTYQTPLQGSMGGNAFTMPAEFGVVNTSYLSAPATTVGVKGGAQALTPTQLGLFHQVDVHTDRKNSSVTAGFSFDPQWSFKFDYNHLDQSGAKLMMASTDSALAASGPSGSTWGVEKMLMLMNPTNYTTDTVNAAINWKGDKGFVNVSYFGSFFRDGYNSLTFPNVFSSTSANVPVMGASGNYPVNTISTMPDNDFNQFNLTGAFNITSATKVAGGFSYGRNTQNDAYPNAMLQYPTGYAPGYTPGATGAVANTPVGGAYGGGKPPQGSLDGLVETYHADLKLTNQTTKDLVLSAGVKYNERDNQTASNTYNFIDLGNKNRTAVNTPMSNRKTQVEVAGDYRINESNRVHLAYEYEGIERWCNNALANNTKGVAPAGYVYTASSCVQVPSSDEHKVAAGYKLRLTEAVNFNAGYSYADRKSDINSSFYNPMQALNEGFENPGYRAFFDASRTEQLVKAGVEWQATDKLSFGLNGRYQDDRYDDSILGVQNGNAWSVNLDSTLSYSENGTISAFASIQQRERDFSNMSGRLPTPGVLAATATVGGGIWTNQMSDDDYAFGLTAKQKGLLGGKLELAGGLTYSLGKTQYTNQVPYFIPTATVASCSSSNSLTCGSTPDIRNRMLSVNVNGNYQIDKANKVVVGYMFQQLESNDYYYNFYQNGYVGTGNLPTNEQSPSYTVNVVTAAYIYSF